MVILKEERQDMRYLRPIINMMILIYDGRSGVYHCCHTYGYYIEKFEQGEANL